jgi:hypothetical protein
MRKRLLSGDFALGIVLIVMSFVVALLSKVVFFLYFTDPIYRNWSIAFYVMSWLMMPVGIWLAGREYYDSIKRYTSLKRYYETAVSRTKKVNEKTRETQLPVPADGPESPASHGAG